ncbi:hypothetical protein JZO70_13590 [Enterococcus sp. 669A]|uniref:Uncharacterized protein n=1 Tax=Candidatus Enterococcus moelleringii TaxID=2815325 RepID=A0ABS3LFQ5_9ENTE|nr:hypothetical protein [Enterococcus sp. 669A]MBO1307204.1 hypothetical protein [Enterococcus sp. 669A]
MQDIITIYFRGNIKIGSFVDDRNDGGVWVITDILSIKKSNHERLPMEMRAVVQKMNTPSDFDEYDPESRFEDYFEDCDEIKDHDFTYMGEIEEEDAVSTCVTNLISISCEKGLMLIEGESKILVPWSDREMEEAVKEEKIRRRKLNVI